MSRRNHTTDYDKRWEKVDERRIDGRTWQQINGAKQSRARLRKQWPP
jgi:hypothetical protein